MALSAVCFRAGSVRTTLVWIGAGSRACGGFKFNDVFKDTYRKEPGGHSDRVTQA